MILAVESTLWGGAAAVVPPTEWRCPLLHTFSPNKPSKSCPLLGRGPYLWHRIDSTDILSGQPVLLPHAHAVQALTPMPRAGSADGTSLNEASPKEQQAVHLEAGQCSTSVCCA